ncbi:helix-turn-helix domain-containing protein [Terrisporobacter muris]|jgi:transcriptional regulator with XRE-family HTH domain|uniref:Helix-turn-helix transcriptional regulator n=1 Tax=Terrisporobacter muris TaxID=2963284 RepID=A0A9X2S2U0_9FIRM|nr:helix-turn-helix transcriptional regulator [Terrisporobacter muris]MCR1822437.1 helix-turn-helix transcriptional regulator [Terrisporobacter muris]
MNTRLKEIRLKKGLSQDEFSKKLGISRSHVASLEGGRKTLTERLINDISREYNVNKQWLISGDGEMFIDPLDDIQLDEDIKEITKLYLSLDENMKRTVKKFIQASLEEKDRD